MKNAGHRVYFGRLGNNWQGKKYCRANSHFV